MIDDNKLNNIDSKKTKESFSEKINAKAQDAKEWVKDAGDIAKVKAQDAKKWVDEKTPEIIEKLEEASDYVKDTAKDASEWLDASSKKAKAWIDAQNVANAQRKLSYELATLKPIFDDNIPNDYSRYPLVNIVENDEKRSKSPVCAGSYGFMSDTKDLEVPNIYVSSFDKFGITLASQVEEGIYYANPYIPHEYIEANNYAKYLKEERVRELVRIAESLGAKYVSVSFKVKEKQVEEVKGGLGLKQGKNKIDLEAENKLLNSLDLSIDKVRDMKGHDNPVVPELVYYKNDKDILSLIESRINGTNTLNRETYSVTYATISQAKQKEAVKVDGAVKALKLGVKQQLSTCYAVEEAIRLSYTIEF